MTLSEFHHTFPAVGSRHTESTLSHVVATEDLRSSRQLCRPSRGFSRASSLSFSPRLSPWATFLRPSADGLRNSGLAQGAAMRSLFIPAPHNAGLRPAPASVGAVREPPVQPYVSAAGQTRADSPLRWGEGVGQALLPVSRAGACRASSQAGVPAPPHQPERDG